MSKVESIGHVRYKLRRIAEAPPLRGKQIGKSHTLHKIADEIGNTIALTDFVNGDDRRMPQLSDAAGLAQKAIEFLRPGEIPGPRHLDGDNAVQF